MNLAEIVNSKSKAFFSFCFSFLTGVALISILDKHIPFLYLYIFAFILITLLITFWQDKTSRFVCLCLFFFFFGVARYLLAFPLPYGHHIQNDIGKELALTGYVSDEPDIRSDGGRYIVKMKNAEFGMLNHELRGKVYLKTNLYPQFQYGDIVTLRCGLESPQPINDFRYDRHLARYGVFTVCNNPRIEKMGEGAGNPVMGRLLGVKWKIAEEVNLLWHEPYASFMAGILYGYRGGLGELNDLFAKTGVTHIVAVSGFNITIIATVLISLCVHLLIPRKKAFWLVSTVIILFVLFAGASGSAVRAGVMGILVLMTKQIGRLSRMGNVLMFTAALMTCINPFILIWDVGFQLSFISTLGLVYLSPLLEKFFTRVPEFIRETLLATISAIIATLPLILFQFGRLSLVAPVVNVLILWLVPWLMLGGFLAVLTSFIFAPLAKIFALISFAGLWYIVAVVKWFAALPFAAVMFPMPWWWMVGVYGVMVYWVIDQRNVLHSQRLAPN